MHLIRDFFGNYQELKYFFNKKVKLFVKKYYHLNYFDKFGTLLNYLDKGLRDDQILYVNLHHKVDDLMNYTLYRHIKKFPAFLDSYELLSVADALISDYSSVFFDYLATRKQIILHIEDYDTYSSYQGLYMNINELPFDKAKTKKEVLDALNRGKTYDDEEAFKYFCKYDTVNNHKKVCQLVMADESGLRIIDRKSVV